MRTLMVSIGWIVDWLMARPAAPAMTSFGGFIAGAVAVAETGVAVESFLFLLLD